MDFLYQKSHILITKDVSLAATAVRKELLKERVVLFEADDFLIEDAKRVVREAYIAEPSHKYLILSAIAYNAVSQNALLKLIEEPPRNIIFIIIAPSKSVLLPTIRSRLPVIMQKKQSSKESIDISLKKLTTQRVFNFVKSVERKKRHEAKALLEALFNQAVVNEKLILNEEQLKVFDDGYRLLELNARPASVFTNILMTFLKVR